MSSLPIQQQSKQRSHDMKRSLKACLLYTSDHSRKRDFRTCYLALELVLSSTLPCVHKGGKIVFEEMCIRDSIKCAASPIIVMGNGRLLFQDLSKGNIRVANPTKDDEMCIRDRCAAGQLKEGEMYDVDFAQLVIETEKIGIAHG